MDPVSLTSAILAITLSCAKATLGIHTLIRTYEDIPSLLSAVCSDCSLISLTLSRLEMLVLQEDEYASARFADQIVAETISKALKECEGTLSELEGKATKLMEGVAEEGRANRAWTKVRFLWEEKEIEELSNRLRYHQISLSSLLQVFQSEGIQRVEDLTTAIQDTLSRHAIVLGQIAILLRHRRRIPRPDLSNLSRLDSELAESADLLSSEATNTLRLTSRGPPKPVKGIHRRSSMASDADLEHGESEQWSQFIDPVTYEPNPIFRVYANVLFEFITETWPLEERITYEHLRHFALYTGQGDVPPPVSWVEQHMGVLWGYAFSVTPLKELYDDWNIPYILKDIASNAIVYLPGDFISGYYGLQWKRGNYFDTDIQDASPQLEREGWVVWLKTLMDKDPSSFYTNHNLVLETLPKAFRSRLPSGPIRREMLPSDCWFKREPLPFEDLLARGIAVAMVRTSWGSEFSDPMYSYQSVPWPFPVETNEGKLHWSLSKDEWTKICESYLFHGKLMYTQVRTLEPGRLERRT